jgi:mono/diheme cytochrome c family protein
MKKLVIGAIGLLLVVIASCESEQSLDYKRYYSEGSMVYQNHCQNCHGTKGEGLAALIPPLTDSVLLKKLPCIVQNGQKGKITVSGKSFDEDMPPAGLSPIQVTEIAIYVSNSFGNQHGFTGDDQVQNALKKCDQ